MAKKYTVEQTSAEYDSMLYIWGLVNNLLSGTEGMREAAEKWLPRQPKEDIAYYNNRLAKSFLYNAYRDTLYKLSGQPFSRDVDVEGDKDLQDTIKNMINDVDGNDTNLTEFSYELLFTACHYGFTCIIVDYPKMEVGATKADEREMNIKPVLIHTPPPSIINFRLDSNGDFEQVRIQEIISVNVGNFGKESRKQIKVWYKDKWEIYQQVKSEEGGGEFAWVLVDAGLHTFGKVPIIPIYLTKKGTLRATPVLEDLAWKNIEHFQSSSDQRNILNFMRTGMYVATGFEDEEIQNIAIGPNQLVSTRNTDAKFQIVESSGSAIQTGDNDLQRIEEQMVVLGLQPTLKSSGNTTATSENINSSREQSQVQVWIRLLEKGLKKAFEYSAQWINEDLPEGFNIDIFNEFGLSSRASKDIESLIKSRAMGDISRETFLAELKRRDVLSNSVTIDGEVDAIEAEGTPLANMTFDNSQQPETE